MAVTRQNTRRLNMMTELLNTRKELNVKLNHRQKKMVRTIHCVSAVE